MRMIIDGKAYDTVTAQLVAEWSNDHSSYDIRFANELLYKKNNGKYFLYLVTKQYADCSKWDDCNYHTQSAVRTEGTKYSFSPMSLERAKEWCEQRANTEYENAFGACDE